MAAGRPLHCGFASIARAPLSSALGGTSELALDQMRAVDKSRIIKPLGALNLADQQAVYAILKELLI